ncbi:helix-turn-helix transcriptional regulator [Aerococcaceae bacterium zg-ZUI334]|uniref:helix-turn-helix transcriptional regulator n=1 Tax=Aerococcaceae bacterium zg-252 TaxID=2796928 RepID=UPI001B8FE8E5|nr:helix-turn-helix transcriptional regulator [Aerococcaceae bacterium zg-ZUI334]
MNIGELFQYISKQLHTLVTDLNMNTQQTIYSQNKQFKDYFSIHSYIFLNIATYKNKYTPIIIKYCENQYFSINYLAEERVAIIGPFLLNEKINIKHSVNENTPRITDIVPPLISFGQLVQFLELIHNIFNANAITGDDIISENINLNINLIKHSFIDNFYENRENNANHNPYDQEIREFTSIENGDLIGLQNSWKEDYTGQIGKLADNPIRQAKNHAIVVITLACRAALKAGVLPELCYSLSDEFIQKVEELGDEKELAYYMHQCEIEYTILARNHKYHLNLSNSNNFHHYINKAKLYIADNLHSKISINHLSQYLQISESYLSHLFKDIEGITPQQFITEEKIKYAKNLLLYSNKPISEIAFSLGYSNQSYFTKVFKLNTKYTPQKFRAYFKK